MKIFQVNTQNPDIEKPISQQENTARTEHISITRNRQSLQTAVERDPGLKDFYNHYNAFEITPQDREAYNKYLKTLTPEEKKYLNKDYFYYELTFSNLGGLVTPIILEFTFDDGSKKRINIPAEIWRRNDKTVSKIFPVKKKMVKITIDPLKETADTDLSNNSWPAEPEINRFELFKYQQRSSPNPMQQEKKGKKK